MAQKIMKNSPLAISKASSQLMLIINGENGFETEIKSFGNVLEQKILRRNSSLLEKRKAVLLENKPFIFSFNDCRCYDFNHSICSYLI
jgi:hypothetical protein